MIKKNKKKSEKMKDLEPEKKAEARDKQSNDR